MSRINWLARAVGAAVVGVSLVSATSAVNIETVHVGNGGNWPDPKTGVGTVKYEYNIGKYEVTADQYTEFLNAVAAADTFGLYNSDMWFDPEGCKIERSGSGTGIDPYTYSVAPDWANRPANFVSWASAARFANWLHNGQPTGAQDLTTTEDGAYFLNGATTWEALENITREAGWKWAITSGEEWYKAAYHKNDGVTENYFDYPTSSDDVPSNVLIDPDPGNNANFRDGQAYTIGPPYWRTEVGEFENSDSPYGTFDQGGNVWEWSEETFENPEGDLYRVLLGGCYVDAHGILNSTPTYFFLGIPSNGYGNAGFRVSQVPEPATLLLLAAGGLILLATRRMWF